MYSFYFNRVKQVYELTEMVRMFLPPSAYTILTNDPAEEVLCLPKDEENKVVRIPDSINTRDEGKRFIYDKLKEHTGQTLDWGTLTGVRPVKLAGELQATGNSREQTLNILMDYYYLSRDKAELILSIRDTQLPYLADAPAGSVALYIGIPFCPTKCMYCSFPSYQVSYDKIAAYLDSLEYEIRFAGKAAAERGLYLESIYIGGGTPSILEDPDLSRLLATLKESFDLGRIKEFTLEAGRPDTVTESKLIIMKENGIDRISINPQSMKEITLEKIGRRHKPKDITEAIKLAKTIGFDVINADLIAGLPDEATEDFSDSLKEILGLCPENITIHTLAVKRASRLKEIDESYSYHQGDKVRQMLNMGEKLLANAGYRPYYLYRQKQMAGNLENIGYSFPGKESVYNIRIMEEKQTILALGAGGISKVWYPEENRLERIPNVSNYEIYIERIEDMIDRKKNGIFNI
ncbi:coproporphyrinogen III oxidase [Bacillota bacterium]